VDSISAGECFDLRVEGGCPVFSIYPGVTLFFTLLILGVLIFFVIKYRRRSPYEIPRPIAGSHKLETLWSVVPFLIAMSIFAWGAQLYFHQSRPPKNADEIYVVGKQWMWKISTLDRTT
jgi:cytochrome c oxidase subunit 2